MTKNVRFAALALTLVASAAALAEPTTGPAVVQASDLPAITASMGKELVVEGVCSKAEWSASGKVMILEFAGVDKMKFEVVAFSKIKDKLDAAFMHDAAKTFGGAKLRVRGTISKYSGKVESLKDVVQIIVSDPTQVTIVEPATGATTAPAAAGAKMATPPPAADER